MRRARTQITLADQAQGQRATLEQQLHDGHSSLVTLQASVQSAQAAWDAWDQSWRAAVLAAGHEATALPDQVEAEIEVMQEVDRLLARIRSTRSERIDTMQADLERVRDDAQLKLWLREQAALARQQAREDAMLERFGDFF